jgi:hypothetical protein
MLATQSNTGGWMDMTVGVPAVAIKPRQCLVDNLRVLRDNHIVANIEELLSIAVSPSYHWWSTEENRQRFVDSVYR